MNRSAFILFLACVAIIGCRESLSGPDLPIVDPIADPVPTPNVAPLYLKGPATLSEGSTGNYRAEPIGHPELDHYEWRVFGIGQMSIEPNDPTGENRLIRAQATHDGPVLLVAQAYASDGRLLAYGEKIVELP